MRNACLLASNIAVGLVLLPVSHASGEIPCRYEVEILSLPPCGIFGVPSASANGLNEKGVMVGHYGRCYPNEGNNEAFVLVGGKLVVIPRPPAIQSARADGISNVGGVNGAGVVTGEIKVPPYNLERAFLFDGRQTIILGLPPGMNWVNAGAINDRNQIVGTTGNTVTGPVLPYIWEKGTMTLVEIAFGHTGGARDINEAGIIVGTRQKPMVPPNEHAFRYDNGRMEDLGFPSGGLSSRAEAINNRNQIAVNSQYDYEVPPHVYQRGFIWTEGRFTDVGLLPGSDACAILDLNDHGQAVGACGSISGGEMLDDAFLWDNGTLIDLQPLAALGSITHIGLPRAINNAGQIAADVRLNFGAFDVAAILTPVPRPSTDLNGDCATGHDDLMILLGDWGMTGSPADVNDDGIVNVRDLLQLLANWG
jgi:probable HAF family extracellular repeat protein